jgi:alkylation response protein AidB-like acyl-CoA dehydrogenase
VGSEAEERRKYEAIMARIAAERDAVAADPAGAMRASLEPAIARARRRLAIWTGITILAAGVVYVLVHR